MSFLNDVAAAHDNSGESGDNEIEVVTNPANDSGQCRCGAAAQYPTREPKKCFECFEAGRMEGKTLIS